MCGEEGTKQTLLRSRSRGSQLSIVPKPHEIVYESIENPHLNLVHVVITDLWSIKHRPRRRTARRPLCPSLSLHRVAPCGVDGSSRES